MTLRAQNSKSQWQKHNDIEENESQTILGLSNQTSNLWAALVLLQPF